MSAISGDAAAGGPSEEVGKRRAILGCLGTMPCGQLVGVSETAGGAPGRRSSERHRGALTPYRDLFIPRFEMPESTKS
jgi:hypothetical protein